MNLPGVDFLRRALNFRERKRNSSSLVYVLQKNLQLGIFTSQSCKDGKEMYKKVLCTCKVVVLLNKPIAFFDVLVAVAVVVAKAPHGRDTR